MIAGADDVGRRLARRCGDAGIAACIVDPRIDVLDELRSDGLPTAFGDASRAEGERAWMREFAATRVVDSADETAAALLRAVRDAL